MASAANTEKVNAKLDVNKEEAATNEAIVFTDLSTNVSIIKERTWDFGDGETSKEKNPQHSFDYVGEYDVALGVTGENITVVQNVTQEINGTFVVTNETTTTEIVNTEVTKQHISIKNVKLVNNQKAVGRYSEVTLNNGDVTVTDTDGFTVSSYTKVNGERLVGTTRESDNKLLFESLEGRILNLFGTPTVTPTPAPVPTVTPSPPSGGANITWGKPSYANGESALLTYSIDAPIFSATGYTFRILTQNNYGGTVQTIPVTTQYGTETITTTSALYPQGTYYAVMQSVSPLGAVTNLALDDMVVETQVLLSGYVHDADTTVVIPNAIISVTQLGVNELVMSDVAGYWSSGNWSAGHPMTLYATKTGYGTQTVSFTPWLAQEYSNVNWSLISQSVANPNTTIRGVVRSGVVPKRPIPSASVTMSNSSMTIITTTNSVGAYRFDDLIFGDSFQIHSTHAGFYDSPTATVTAGV
jgi:PKD repeat protein